MKLIVHRDDLLPESKDKGCSKIGFNDLNGTAQAAVLIIGKARFEEYDGSNYNIVYSPPKEPR